jgi:ATP-dependent DNA helicase RecQ
MSSFEDFAQLRDLAILKCLNDFKVKHLKKEQRECLEKVLNNKDVLAVLPTGYGKSLIYQLLPSVYEEMYRQTHEGISSPKRCCIVVVSPLEYIRKQQVLKLERLDCGINAASIGES